MYEDEKILEIEFVVDDTVEAVVLVEQFPTDSLAAKDLHATVTLLRELRSRVSCLIADARDEETSWADRSHLGHWAPLGASSLRDALAAKEDAFGTRLIARPDSVGSASQAGVGSTDHRHILEIPDAITGITGNLAQGVRHGRARRFG